MNIDRLLDDEISKISTKKKDVEKHELTKVDGLVTKKTPWQTFKSNFIEEDLPTVVKDIRKNVIRPTIKGLFYDIVVGWAERTFGVGGVGSRTARSLARSVVRSDLFDDEPSWRRGRVKKTEPEKISIDYLIMQERDQAQAVKDILLDACAEYKQVSVGELYGALEFDERDFDYTAYYFGWKDLRDEDIRISRVANGWRVVLPRPVSLK